MLTEFAAVSGMDTLQPSASPYEFRAIAPAAYDSNRSPSSDRANSDSVLRESLDLARRESFDEGRREGQRVARAEQQAAAAGDLARERTLIAGALKEFRDTRNQYFTGVEQEVVRLALAIAARVLHREVLLDPLLLAGVVRVALGHLSDRTNVVLRVPATDVAAWQETFHTMEPADRPSIVAGASLSAGECLLETSVGSVELGIAAQLEEIERGFFDLLSHRPVS